MHTSETKFFFALPNEILTKDIEAFTRKAVEIIELYAKKNKDYGNAFHASFIKWGIMYLLSRLDDKLNRLTTITKNGSTAVTEESVKDTLMDIAAYALMGLVELEKQNETV